MSYSKLHSSLVNSSLWTEPDNVRILFITLLAMCDRQGYVYGSKPGIERLANIDPTDDIDPWDALMSPDEDSSDRLRNPENEGRRIEEVPGGFRLLNFEYYRGLRNDDDRREQSRIAQDKHRAKKESAEVSHDKPKSVAVSRRQTIPSASASVSESSVRSKCTQQESEDFCESIGLPRSDGTAMFLHWEEKGWAKVKDWKLTIRKWQSFGYMPSQKAKGGAGPVSKKSMSSFEIQKRIEAINDEINKIFGKAPIFEGEHVPTLEQRAEIDKLKARKAELKKEMTT